MTYSRVPIPRKIYTYTPHGYIVRREIPPEDNISDDDRCPLSETWYDRLKKLRDNNLSHDNKNG